MHVLIDTVITALIVNTDVELLFSIFSKTGDYEQRLTSYFGLDGVRVGVILRQPVVVEALCDKYLTYKLQSILEFFDEYDFRYGFEGKSLNYIKMRYKRTTSTMSVIKYFSRDIDELDSLLEREMVKYSHGHIMEAIRAVSYDIKLVEKYKQQLEFTGDVYDEAFQEAIIKGYDLEQYREHVSGNYVQLLLAYERWDELRRCDFVKEHNECSEQILYEDRLELFNDPNRIPEDLRKYLGVVVSDGNLLSSIFSSLTIPLRILKQAKIDVEALANDDELMESLYLAGTLMCNLNAFRYLYSIGLDLTKLQPNACSLIVCHEHGIDVLYDPEEAINYADELNEDLSHWDFLKWCKRHDYDMDELIELQVCREIDCIEVDLEFIKDFLESHPDRAFVYRENVINILDTRDDVYKKWLDSLC